MSTVCSRKLLTCKHDLSFLLGCLPCLMERPSNDSIGNHPINLEKSIGLTVTSDSQVSHMDHRATLKVPSHICTWVPVLPPLYLKPKWKSGRCLPRLLSPGPNLNLALKVLFLWEWDLRSGASPLLPSVFVTIVHEPTISAWLIGGSMVQGI